MRTYFHIKHVKSLILLERMTPHQFCFECVVTVCLVMASCVGMQGLVARGYNCGPACSCMFKNVTLSSYFASNKHCVNVMELDARILQR